MKKIYLNLAHMGGKELDFVNRAFTDDWVAPLGPNVDAFEEDLKSFVGEGKEVLALSSGTAAIHLGLIGCGVNPGDEVIAQSFTFCASINPIVYLGANPVLVDSEPETWNMDPDLLEEAIADRLVKTGKLPKAIVPVSLYGMPYQIDRILAIANRYGIPIVEDSAEALGSCFNGRHLGTFGRFGVLSFNGNKMITTSGGGALICPDLETKKQMLKLATQARESRAYYHHEILGYNYRMSNVCAGIGRGQMFVIDEHIAYHRRVASLYAERLKDIPGIQVHENPSSAFESNYWLTAITLDSELHIRGQKEVQEPEIAPNANVMALLRQLELADIESRPLWKPMHLQPLYQEVPFYGKDDSVCKSLFRKGLCLPSGPRVGASELRYISDVIHDAVAG